MLQTSSSSFAVEIFQQEVLDYLSESLMLKEKHGSDTSKSLLVNSLLRPPSISTIRVNTYHYKKSGKFSTHDEIMEQAKKELETIFNNKYKVERSATVEDCLVIPVNELSPNYSTISDQCM